MHSHLWLLLGICSLCAAEAQGICQNGLIYAGDTDDSYFYCMQGQLVSSSCPAGSYFDPSYLVCRHGKRPSAADGAGATGICQTWGLAADLTDCNRFYHCTAKGATMERRSCGTGQIFNNVYFNCVPGAC